MFRNYLAAALRNLVRNRLYSVINITGLALGFTAALLIALFVRDEFSYDHFFPDYQHIYLVGGEHSLPGRAIDYPDFTPTELAPLLKADFPSIDVIARIVRDGLSVRHGAIENLERVHWADPNIFDIFKFKVVAGSLENALEDPNSIVITRKMARKYFGRDDPIDQTLEFRMSVFAAGRETAQSDVFKVTAVIADLPSNTHLSIDILAAAQNANSVITRIGNTPPRQGSYYGNSETYIKLPSAAAAALVQNGLADFMKRHKPDVANPGNGLYVKLILRPIASLHLMPSSSGVEKPRGNISTIYGMAGIGLLIVFAAAINFVNLMTARAMRRATEVGVRKVTGAVRRDLMTQFICEATIYVAIGMGCGLMLAAVLLPRLNTFLDRTIELGLLTDIRSSGSIAAFVILLGVLAGAYPAFVLAAIRPAGVLRGIVGQQASSRIRQSLVVLQFAVLIGLSIATGVVYRQTQYAFTEAKRLDTDQVVLIMGAAPCMAAFKEGLSAVPGVRAVACSSGSPFGGLNNSNVRPTKDANGTYVTIEHHSVGYGFFEFYGLKPIAGRFFSEAHPADAMPTNENALVQGAVVLNETAVRRLGFALPQDAIGKSTSLNDKTGAPAEIIGVVPDFAADAVHKVVPPTLYFTGRDRQGVLSVRIDGAGMPETLVAIDKFWKQVGPPWPMTRQFLDQHIAYLYKDITRQGTLFAVFAGVAVSIAMLGLFGMSASISERRTKEIGIRKAMGASRTEILQMLLWEFAKPVQWANLIAWPVAGYAMHLWLDGFAHHIDLEPWMFLAASALAVVISLSTVVGHALLIARAQPVAALRYE
jgi:putative ABC transport system permease protein